MLWSSKTKGSHFWCADHVLSVEIRSVCSVTEDTHTIIVCLLQVATKVEEGVKQLVQAEKTQKQSRTILCIVFLLVAVIFMLFIVVFKAIFF